MTLKMLCHHGHWLEITAELTDEEFVCHRCGSVMSCRPDGETRGSQPVDITIDSVNASRGGTSSKEKADDAGRVSAAAGPVDDAESSMFLTLDHAFPTDAGSGKPSVAAGSRDLASDARGSAGPSSSTPLSEPLEPPQLPGLEVLEELGRGGMGVVYRARDKALGREVALKTLQRMNPDSLRRFKQEFRVLADIAHPNLASLYELLSDGHTWCFSMEILEGVEFLEYVWSGFEKLASSVDETSRAASETDRRRLTGERMQRLRDAMTQLAAGLNALHAAGILHTDIKPSNVLVTTEGRLVLLDFGLAVPLDPKKGGAKLIQGTPRYMSPEQANAEPLTAASDWYSVGVMLYEVLTGRLPVRGNTMQILSKKRAASPIEPWQHQLDNPKHLNDLCMALLNPNPEKRPSVEEVLRCFSPADATETMIMPRRAVAFKSVELVGRERHFERLRASFAQVSAGGTLSMFVHGKSGMGKSVLVRSFLDGINASQEAIVLEGRCYEQESVPFKALDSLIDS
ncbi:MAG: serine/threonine-protein kinase, partial [Planctomycetota bacterium]|nr:serine/threonine-protein kinase [Planctomycetota bacterium]